MWGIQYICKVNNETCVKFLKFGCYHKTVKCSNTFRLRWMSRFFAFLYTIHIDAMLFNSQLAVNFYATSIERTHEIGQKSLSWWNEQPNRKAWMIERWKGRKRLRKIHGINVITIHLSFYSMFADLLVYFYIEITK